MAWMNWFWYTTELRLTSQNRNRAQTVHGRKATTTSNHIMFSNFPALCKSMHCFSNIVQIIMFCTIIDLTGISIWYNCLKCIIINVTIVFILYDRSIHLVVACNFSSLACPGSTNIDVGPMLYPDEYNITQYEGRFDEFYQALLTRNYRFGEMPQTPGGKTYSQPISFFLRTNKILTNFKAIYFLNEEYIKPKKWANASIYTHRNLRERTIFYTSSSFKYRRSGIVLNLLTRCKSFIWRDSLRITHLDPFSVSSSE